MLKRCFRCHKEQTRECFYADRTKADGLGSECKLCRHSRSVENYRENRQAHLDAAHRYYRNNAQRIIAQVNLRYNTDPEYRAKVLARVASPEVLDKIREWKKSPDGRASDLRVQHRRRALKAGNGGSYTEAEWQERMRWCRGRCFWCDVDLTDQKIHRDHVIPIVHGGTSNIDNLVPSCVACNETKKAQLIDVIEFRNARRTWRDNPDRGFHGSA